MNKKIVAILIIILICFVVYIFTYSPDHTYINSSNPEAESMLLDAMKHAKNSTDRAIYVNSLSQ